MPGKLPKDPLAHAIATGCIAGCLTYFILGATVFSNLKNPPAGMGIAISVIIGFIAFVIVKQIKTTESNLENKKIEELVNSSQAQPGEPSQTINQQIQFMKRATYFGGDKQYGTKSDVSVVFTKDRILIKELPGNPTTRMDIPYGKIIDFGLATKEQLTVSRMLIVGILAFALKKKTQYLFVKYKDKLGFENNPVLGEFVESNVSDVSQRLYTIIERHRTS